MAFIYGKLGLKHANTFRKFELDNVTEELFVNLDSVGRLNKLPNRTLSLKINSHLSSRQTFKDI